MDGILSFARPLMLWPVLRLSPALSCYGWCSVFRQIPRYDHRQAEFCPKLCLSPLFLHLEPPFWEATGNFDPETLPVSPVFVPLTLISGTDRQLWPRNSACLSRFRAFDPHFEHRQALNRPKLCLSVIITGHQILVYTKVGSPTGVSFFLSNLSNNTSIESQQVRKTSAKQPTNQCIK